MNAASRSSHTRWVFALHCSNVAAAHSSMVVQQCYSAIALIGLDWGGQEECRPSPGPGGQTATESQSLQESCRGSCKCGPEGPLSSSDSIPLQLEISNFKSILGAYGCFKFYFLFLLMGGWQMDGWWWMDNTWMDDKWMDFLQMQLFPVSHWETQNFSACFLLRDSVCFSVTNLLNATVSSHLVSHELPPVGGAGQHSLGKVPQAAARAGRGWGASRHCRVASQQAARQKPWCGLQGTRSRWRTRRMCVRKRSFSVTLFIYETEKVTIEVVIVWLDLKKKKIYRMCFMCSGRCVGISVMNNVIFGHFHHDNLMKLLEKGVTGFKNSTDTFKWKCITVAHEVRMKPLALLIKALWQRD